MDLEGLMDEIRLNPASKLLELLEVSSLTAGLVLLGAFALELLAGVLGLTGGVSPPLVIVGLAALGTHLLTRTYTRWRARRVRLSSSRIWTTVAWTSGLIALVSWAPDILRPESLGRLQWTLILAGVVGMTIAVALRDAGAPIQHAKGFDTAAEGSPSEPHIEGKQPSRVVSTLMVGILLFSLTITALTVAVLSPRGAPDERHHYSYVVHMAENPLEFPPRFETQQTDDGDFNHLIHPPLYYQLMAFPYGLLYIERQLASPDVGVDAYDIETSKAVIPALRVVSVILVALHLLGLFLLLTYLVRAGILPGWGAVVAAASLALVPAFTYIGGTVNNDVLALAVWPFLALTTVRYVREGERRDVYFSVILASAAALTKATLWVLVLTSAVAIIGILVFRAVRAATYEGSRSLRTVGKAMWSRVRPYTRAHWVYWLTGLASLAAVIYYFSAMQMTYGQLQPGYTTVYGLSPEESKFRNIPEGGIVQKGPLEFSMWAATLLFRSLFGILGQHERIYPSNPERLAQMMILLTVVAVALAVHRLLAARKDSDNQADWLFVGLLVPAFVFMGIFLFKAFRGYHGSGHFGAQGRYLIGYVDLWLIGVLGLSWRAFLKSKYSWSKMLGGFLAAFVVIALLWLFVDPLFYLQRTNEFQNQLAGLG